MATDPIGRVFDDERDHWVVVLPGETERDALLRSRQDGKGSDPVGRRSPQPTLKQKANEPLRALTWISIGLLATGVIIVIVALNTFPEFNPMLDANASIIFGEPIHIEQDLSRVENYLLASVGAGIASVGGFAGLLALTAASINARLTTTR